MKESEPIKRRLFNIREVAEYTGLSVYTLYTWSANVVFRM
jgi:predicted DNA-binding transcriptional regulator AlpA